MLAVLVRRLPRVAVREPLGFPVNASGVVAEVTNIACDAARCGAGARRAFSAAAARVGAKSRQLDQRALLSPFRRHLSVSPQTAAWKKTPDGFVRVGEHVKTNTTRSSSASRPASRGTQKTTRIVTATSVQRDDSAMGKSNAPTSNTNNSKPTHQKQKGYQTKGVGSRAFIQVLGLGVDVNDTSPSVLLFTDTERILFNVGEGFQRFSVEHQINIRKLNRICLTQVNSRTTGGLTGMLLTMADGATELLDTSPELKIHGPPRVERLMAAVDTLVGGRGVRTTVHSFPTTDAGGGKPTVDDDCVRLTPIVVRPKINEDGGNKKTGPLGSLDPPAKRAKTGEEAVVEKKPSTVFSALSVPSNLAESVCYHGQLAGMPGKFDAAKADAINVPRGALRGQLVRGEDVTLPDGRLIKSSDVVAPSRKGFRFFVVDLPTMEHLREVMDCKSAAHKQFVDARDGHTPDELIGDLAVVVHLAPPEVAMTTEYAQWMETCSAFESGVRHLMVHSHATGEVPVFRAAAAINARLHAIDSSIFPEPRNAELSNEKTQRDILATASALEKESKTSTLTQPGCNLAKFTLVPLDVAGLDFTKVPKPPVAQRVREELEVSNRLNAHTGDTETADTPTTTPAPLTPTFLSHIKPGDLELSFLGTGSSMPAKYRNVSGIFFDSNLSDNKAGSMFVDCGEGSYGQLVRLYGVEGAKERLRKLKTVWISHIHADHHVGLPTVLVERRKAILEHQLSMGKQSEDEQQDSATIPPLLVIGPAPLRRFLNAFSQVEPLDFEFVDCRQTVKEKWDEHALRLEKNSEENGDDDRFALDECVVTVSQQLGLERLVSVPVVHCAHSFALSLESEPVSSSDDTTTWKVVYSGDTRPCEALTSASKDATLLIHEATFEDDLAEDAVKKRHSTTSEAIKTGVDANAYRTILTHFSQRYPKAPVFDGNFFSDGKEKNSSEDSSIAHSAEESIARVGVAFDLMRVDFTSLPRVPSLMPAIRALFPDPVEDEVKVDEGDAN